MPYTNGGGVLVDGRTGHSRNISTPGCRAVAVGAPWVAFSCGDPQTFELYNIPTGRFEPFTGLAPYLDCVRDCLPIAAVGAHWVAFVVPPLNYHDYPAFAFQNLQTSQVVENDPASSTTSLDLNSPQLVQSICRPLTLPPVVSAVGSGWGSLTFLNDGFAIAFGNDGAYLERCGSHLHEFLTQTRAVDGESSYLLPRVPACEELTRDCLAGGHLLGVRTARNHRNLSPEQGAIRDPRSGEGTRRRHPAPRAGADSNPALRVHQRWDL
jgi:hypothetical protein